MSNIITIKHGANKPSVNNLSNFELGFCTGDGHLYINNNGTIVSTKSGTATVLTGESIPSSADLNTYTTPGSYRSSSKDISANLANVPFTATGFKLEVFNTTTANQIMQEIKCNSTSSRVYRRIANFENGVWSFKPWYKVMQSATDTLSVVDGGTGVDTLPSGQVLIGNDTSAVTTREIINITTKGSLGWTDKAANGVYIPTLNTLAYWNGRYNDSSSNLAYCVKGPFGEAAIKGVATSAISGSADLITSGAVYTELAKKSDTSHKHAAGDITSGKLSVARGGTNGANAFEATDNLLALYLGNLTNTANDLAENSNLDDITTGVYRSGTKEISATITNAPTTAAGFRLIASHLTTSSSFVQMAISYSSNVNIWIRVRTTSWGDWKKLTFA